MNGVLVGLENFCMHLSDYIIGSSHCTNEHTQQLKTVINRLNKYNLALNTHKCHFGVQKIVIFGHTVTRNGIAVDRRELVDIEDWHKPKRGKDIEHLFR